MLHTAINNADKREAPRHEVHHRARATLPDGRQAQLLIVNVSQGGLMARCEAALHEGERLRVHLPSMGQVDATIRWALGGRFGCAFDAAIPLPNYMVMLAAMTR